METGFNGTLQKECDANFSARKEIYLRIPLKPETVCSLTRTLDRIYISPLSSLAKQHPLSLR
jgi:hypothetical protein